VDEETGAYSVKGKGEKFIMMKGKIKNPVGPPSQTSKEEQKQLQDEYKRKQEEKKL